MENNANSDCHVTTSTQPQINKTLISFNYETPNQQNPETLISPNNETPNQQDPETLISPYNETPNQQNPETLISPNNETPKQQDPVTLIAFNNETPKQQDPVTLISFNNETAKQQDPVTLIAFPKQQDPGTLISFNNETPKQQDPVTLIAFNNETPKQQIPDSPISEPEEDADQPSAKKLKPLNDLAALTEAETTPVQATPNGTTQPSKKSKKKNINSVWTKPTSRKGKKKNKNNNNSTPNDTVNQQTVAITPVLRIPDKTDDTPDMKICLSKVYKAEKVELSDDRMSAGSTKGYRMVRATRGVVDGAWYFEIRVVKLGETGHTRLGWSNEKGDLQAPVGYDANSFGYRDIDGSKVHKALREKYGDEGYKEGDVLGFYINLPVGSLYAQKPPKMVLFKGQRYVCTPDEKDDPPKVVPGSEISFFKNGICQGVAFQELIGGCYYPVASMYTLPNQPHCVVKFNFGPEFEYFPEDFGGRPLPRPMAEVPYHTFDGRVENGNHSWVSQSTRMFPVPRFVKDQVNAVADITKTF